MSLYFEAPDIILSLTFKNVYRLYTNKKCINSYCKKPNFQDGVRVLPCDLFEFTRILQGKMDNLVRGALGHFVVYAAPFLL